MIDEELNYIADHLTDPQALEYVNTVRFLVDGHKICEQNMDAEIDRLNEENQKLKDAYTRLVKRLRRATPPSLYATTEADLKEAYDSRTDS